MGPWRRTRSAKADSSRWRKKRSSSTPSVSTASSFQAAAVGDGSTVSNAASPAPATLKEAAARRARPWFFRDEKRDVADCHAVRAGSSKKCALERARSATISQTDALHQPAMSLPTMAKPLLNGVLHQLRHLAAVETYRTLGDAQLLDRFASAGDQAAFTVLIDRYAPPVFAAGR